MVYHLLAVNMIWKVQHATNPDEEKKKMIEFDTTTSTNNISSNNYINFYNFYSNESPTCLSKGFQMENLKMTNDVFKKWKEDKNTNHSMTWLCLVTSILLILLLWRKTSTKSQWTFVFEFLKTILFINVHPNIQNWFHLKFEDKPIPKSRLYVTLRFLDTSSLRFLDSYSLQSLEIYF